MANGNVVIMVTKFDGQNMGKFYIKERMLLTKHREYRNADFPKCKINDDSTLEVIDVSTEKEWNEQEMEYQFQQLRNMNTV